MGVLARFLSNTIILTGTLGAALVTMQAPTVTSDYLAALQQIAGEARQNADQLLAAARRQYRIAATAEDDVLQAVRKSEPAAAERLTEAIGRARALRDDHERIATAPPLLRPLLAAWDVVRDASGHQRAIAEIVIERSTPALHLDPASSLYAVAGVLLGSLVVHLLLGALSLLARIFRPLRRRRPEWYVPPQPISR
jgi:hypothetical protein